MRKLIMLRLIHARKDEFHAGEVAEDVRRMGDAGAEG